MSSVVWQKKLATVIVGLFSLKENAPTKNTPTFRSSIFAEGFLYSCSENGVQNGNFVIDSGASSPMFSDWSLFTNFSDKVERWVKNANFNFSKVEMIGNVRESFGHCKSGTFCYIFDCLLLPNHAQIWISVSKFDHEGVTLTLEEIKKR